MLLLDRKMLPTTAAATTATTEIAFGKCSPWISLTKCLLTTFPDVFGFFVIFAKSGKLCKRIDFT